MGGCQPTSSIYWGGPAYDWLCCFSNYHTEHHDFPDVPAFRLRALRDAAPEFYGGEVTMSQLTSPSSDPQPASQTDRQMNTPPHPSPAPFP